VSSFIFINSDGVAENANTDGSLESLLLYDVLKELLKDKLKFA
jgi:hypothetical protein